MQLGAGQLAALVAVVRHGSFDGAAAQLHVTASAVSQRIKQLEEQVGAALVVRASPCEPTAVGEAVFRHALQVEVLERDLTQTLSADAEGGGSSLPLVIAVNADSLATWVVPAVQSLTASRNVLVELKVDDQDYTAAWLRSGRVMAAVTSQAKPVRGCRVHPLGTMRYIATASPRFCRRWLPQGTTSGDLAAAPSIAYDRRDRMCGLFLDQVFGTGEVEIPTHHLPSPQAYLDACLRGVGWGLNPSTLCGPALRRKRLVDLCPGSSFDVPLYWQQWSIASASLDALAATITDGAAATLEAGA